MKFKEIVGTYILICLMLMCSGTVIFNVKYNSIFIPLFVVYSFCFAIITEQGKLRVKKNEFILFLIITCFILASTVVYYHDGVAINGVVQKLFYLFGTWCACKTITYKNYKDIYENIVVLMCVVAIIIQVLIIVGILSYQWTDINGRLFPLALGHCVSWRSGNFYRLSGLYIEPGMFQIIVNIAIMYLIDDIQYVNEKKEKKRMVLFLGICIVSVLMTLSTTGYICLAILMVGGIVKIWKNISNIVLKRAIVVLIPILIGSVIYKILKSNVIINKFASDNYSLLIRKNDVQSGITLMFNKPILGYGYGTKSLSAAFEKAGIANISSGLVGESISFGLIVVVTLIFLMLMNAKRCSRYVVLISIAFYLIANMSESCLFFPVLLTFCFSFKRDQDYKLEDNLSKQICKSKLS